jgi:hypothetical protein
MVPVPTVHERRADSSEQTSSAQEQITLGRGECLNAVTTGNPSASETISEARIINDQGESSETSRTARVVAGEEYRLQYEYL